MSKRRPISYNPEEAIRLVIGDREGVPLDRCPTCAGTIERLPRAFPPPATCSVTLRCSRCGRSARYVAGAA
jgi:hypothetical protein